MAEIIETLKGKTCFVVMGFGKKTDLETGRVFDLDKTYKYIIKPAVVETGLTCIRADEIVHSGVIDVPMYEQLLNADIVVADVSTANNNAFYELGIRHALRPFTTVVMAEDGMKNRLPFDTSRVLVRHYEHMGTGIDYGVVLEFKKSLTSAILEIMNASPPKFDSPIYTVLKGLVPPSIIKQLV